jgi:hypothetical protein
LQKDLVTIWLSLVLAYEAPNEGGKINDLQPWVDLISVQALHAQQTSG